MSEKENSEYPKLLFAGNYLDVLFEHKRIATKDEVEWRRWVTQQRFKDRLGREIPLEEIHVQPEVGEAYKVVTSFRVKAETEGLYFGLRVINQEDPLILPELTTWLESYEQSHQLLVEQEQLLRTAIGGLQGIILNNPTSDVGY